MKSKLSGQRGFTLVELVVVIMILGILAATALPKFMDVSKDAHKAAVAGVAGSLTSAVQIAHAQWVVNGSSATAGLVKNFGSSTGDVYANASGWAIGNSSDTSLSCLNVWSALMQGAPTVSATAAAADWAVTTSSNTCTYIYQKDLGSSGSTTAAAAGTAVGANGFNRNITYNTSTGVVTIVNNP